jgi:hypothetical protein
MSNSIKLPLLLLFLFYLAPVVPPWLNNVEWCCFSLLFLLSSNKNYGKAVLLPFLSGKKNVQGGFIQQALFLKSEPKIPSSVSI